MGVADQEGDLFQWIARQLAEQGYCVLEQALPAAITAELYQRVSHLPSEQFRRAGIGRLQQHQLDDSYRTDEIHWLESEQPAEAPYLAWMEQLRLGINRSLFMGLFDYEAHFAHYAPGTFYKRHLDAFQGNTNRVVTTVFYLNPDWQVDQGGAIHLYADQHATTPFQTVLPQQGTLVVFLSDQFPHEVVAANRDRFSIAGWFRVKSVGAMIDPPR